MNTCGASPEDETALREALEETVAGALLDPQKRLDAVLALIHADESLAPYVARLREEGASGEVLYHIELFYESVAEGERTLKEALALM